LWKVDLGGPINASPIVAGGKVYVMTVSGLLACLSADDGKELWRLTLDVPDDDAYSSPTLAEGKLYVAASGKLYCIGDKSLHAP
jgi:outer membrane protein assembly factor BamB